jgi:cytochrome c556
MKLKLTLALIAAACAATAFAHEEKGTNDLIKFRQSGYTFMAWNMGRIKAQLANPTPDMKQIEQAANVIAATASSGMGALFAPGTEKGKGWEPTHAKPELFKDHAEVGKLAGNLKQAADNLQMSVASGDAAAVKTAFGDLGKACKACHDKFREKE